MAKRRPCPEKSVRVVEDRNSASSGTREKPTLWHMARPGPRELESKSGLRKCGTLWRRTQQIQGAR
eukprot:4794113-Prorocentrum_lima.AAC.1